MRVHKRTTSIVSRRLPVKNRTGLSDVSYLEWTDRARWHTCIAHSTLQHDNHTVAPSPFNKSMWVLLIVGPKCTPGRVACCPLVSHGKYADGTDRQVDRRTDARELHYTFRYSRGQHNKITFF